MKEIKCKTCGELFTPKSEKNIFCSRKCFKKDFYKRKKNQIIEITFPDFICKNCNKTIKLTFDPIEEPFKWLSFRCPYCNVLLVSVSDHMLTEDISMQ